VGKEKMKKEMLSIFLLVTLFLVSVFPMITFSGAAHSHSGFVVFGTHSSVETTGQAAFAPQIKAQIPQTFFENGLDTRLSVISQPHFEAKSKQGFGEDLGPSDFAYVGNDSVELITGLNVMSPNTYSELSNLIISDGGKLVNTISMGGKVNAVVADIHHVNMSAFVSEVEVAGLSRYVEPNIRFKADFVPNDPDWTKQWGPRTIQADYAWNTTRGNASILVAVIDTGIDWHHPDLAANYVPLGYDWVNNDTDPADDAGHGTHCAGIIAAVLDNNIGIAGLAQIRIRAEKAIDQNGFGYEDNLANAIVHAVDQGANILSLSWGGPDSALIHDAINYAYSHGALVIAAAGNDATECKHYPAAYENVMAVTATNESDKPAYFTSFGDWVEVAAPGVDIYSTMPTYPVTLNLYGYDLNYGYLSGTSMACPQVAGVAALIWSRFPNITRDQVRAQLRYTADDLGDPGFDEYYGYGRVNARKAVEQVIPEHDVAILNWQSPFVLKTFSSATINGTLLNFGTNNENHITVQLLVNETVVDSESISQLASGASTTLSLTWSPLTEGKYNVTLYVAPVEGERFMENNFLSEYVTVRSSEIVMVPGDFLTIQKAINEVDPGYTIQVASGIYRERLVIDRSIALIGENRDSTVIDGKGIASVITVNSEQGNVSVNGFTVQNSGQDGIGIVLECSNNNISENVLTNDGWGIVLWGSTGNIIVGNTISGSSRDGMYLESSGGNLVRSNRLINNVWNLDVRGSNLSDYVQDIDTSNTVNEKPVYYWVNEHDRTVPLNAGYVAAVNSTRIDVKDLNLTNNGEGVLFEHTTDSTIANVLVSGNAAGISLEDSSGNFISGSTATYNIVNIWLYSHSNSNIVKDNKAAGGMGGIWVEEESNDNIIENNTVSENAYLVGVGMMLDFSSDDNIIVYNEVRSNKVGVEMAGSPCKNNTLYRNNFVNNAMQVTLCGFHVNVWDGGYPSGGNYWSDYKGEDFCTGFYQNETGSDGIGDTPYTIDANNIDRFPYLIEVKGPYILGDLNHDGRIDGKDLGAVAQAFASYGPDFLYSGSQPHPRWDPNADMNDDNKVDGKDLGIVASRFGK
jgi:thermitase